MKRTSVIWLLTCLALTGRLSDANAQGFPIRPLQQVEAELNPSLLERSSEILRFDRTVQNIGTLTEDDAPRSVRFTCVNVSGKPLTLTRVKTTCGCAAAEVKTGRMMPGERRTLTLTYHPKDHVGTVDANAFVYLSASDKKPVARLTLTGNVLPGADEWARYPYAMGKLRLKQKSVSFREANTAAGHKFTERILCGNSGIKPLKLSTLLIPKFATFRTEPEVITPGNEADIVISIDTSLLPAETEFPFSFPIVLEGVEGRPSDRTVKVTIL